MNSDNRSPSRAGATLVQMILAAAILLTIGVTSYSYMRKHALAEEAAKNLRLIHMALRWYDTAVGQLPDLAFYPTDPRNDDDSLLFALADYGVNEQMTVCPGAPDSLRAEGLNYVWNARLNGKKLHEIPGSEWMLVDIHALSPSVPPPHLGKYSILRADGQVEFSRTPPHDVPI